MSSSSFLGDSVIGLITADFFYSSYQDMTEGDLSKLKILGRLDRALAEFAKQIKLDKHIHLGHGERAQRRPQEIDHSGWCFRVRRRRRLP